MDIEKLKKKRQLNVEEQNAVMKHGILREALYWRNNGIPLGLRTALESKGINTEKSIYLNYDQDFPGVSTDEGTVITPNGEFYKFKVDLGNSRSELVEFYSWENITVNTEIQEHRAGTGATWGFMALQVLAKLNQC